jgi:hypothetical protein
MLERELHNVENYIQRDFRYDGVATPYILLPVKLSAHGEVRKARNLSSVPPVNRMLDTLESGTYFQVRTDELSEICELNAKRAELAAEYAKNSNESPTQPEILSTDGGSVVQIMRSGIVYMPDFRLDEADDFSRRTQRQLQRLNQFKRITEVSDIWERNLDGKAPDEDEAATRNAVMMLRRAAASRYEEELSIDPSTKQEADKIISSRLPEPKVVVQAAKEHIRRLVLNLEDVFSSVDRALHLKKPDPKLNDSAAANKRKSKEKRSENDPEKVVEETAKHLAEVQPSIYQDYLIQKSGLLYVYDPDLDEPSADAAEFVQELWDRPF